MASSKLSPRVADRILHLYVDLRWSMDRVAADTGAPKAVVRRVLVEEGMTIRRRGDPSDRSRSGLTAAGLNAAKDAGATVQQIAADLGVTDRAVRYALRRFGIAPPSRTARASQAMIDAYVAGASLADAGRIDGVAVAAARSRLVAAGVEIRPPNIRPLRVAELNDRERLIGLVDAGLNSSQIARRVGCSRHAVRVALHRFRLEVAPTVWPEASRAMIDAYVAGAGLKKAGAIDGISDRAARRRLLAAGVPIRPDRRPPIRFRELHDRTWMASRFAVGIPIGQIAAEIGCATSSVYRARGRLDL